MYIKEFGIENEKKLLFLPGAISDYSWYLPSIVLLSEKWHTFVVIYDGYHEPFHQSFVSVEHTVDQVLDFCTKRNINEFDLVYGISMGGVVANLIYTYDKLNIETLIIDGATAPYHVQYPDMITKLILFRDCLILRMLRKSKTILKLAFPPERWLLPGEDEQKVYQEIHDYLNQLTVETMKNSFESTYQYRLPNPLPTNDTNIYYFYGELEDNMKVEIDFFKKTYPRTVFKEFPDTAHGELCTMKPKVFFKTITEIAK